MKLRKQEHEFKAKPGYLARPYLRQLTNKTTLVPEAEEAINSNVGEEEIRK